MVMNMNKNQTLRINEALEIFKNSTELSVNSKRRLFKKQNKCALSFSANKSGILKSTTDEIATEMNRATECTLKSARQTSTKYYLLLLIAGSQFLHNQRKAAH